MDKKGDHAYATVITCSDSRVPVERLFDAGDMDIFVIRVAENVCDTDVPRGAGVSWSWSPYGLKRRLPKAVNWRPRPRHVQRSAAYMFGYRFAHALGGLPTRRWKMRLK